MSDDFQEDVGFMHTSVGPTIRLAEAEKTFTVFCALSSREWLTSTLMLADGRTLGAANRACIHHRLDEFLNAWLKEEDHE